MTRRDGAGSNEFVLYGAEPPADLLARCGGAAAENGTKDTQEKGAVEGDAEGSGGRGADDTGEEEEEEEGVAEEAAGAQVVEGGGGAEGGAACVGEGGLDGEEAAVLGDEDTLPPEQALARGWELVVKGEVRRGAVRTCAGVAVWLRV